MGKQRKFTEEKEKAAIIPPILERSDFKSIKFTPKQLEFFKTVKNNSITVCVGPAGTAKTFMSCYTALNMLQEGSRKKIILTRPVVESGENLGFLPGDINEKIAPYMKSFISNMGKILHRPEKITSMIERKIIDMEPLAFMRGDSYDDSIMVLDEAQNTDMRQLMLFTTRLGHNSSMIISGDITQWDLRQRRGELKHYYENIIKDVPNCTLFQFGREDIVRNPLLIAITDNYEKYKEANNLD